MTRFLSIILLFSFHILSAQADIYSASAALSRGDYETAVAEFTKLADKGDANAQANLGYMYYAGEGVPQDYEKAVYWYRKAAVQGNKDAQYNLAVSYAFGEGTKQDLTEAAIWYRRAGEQNHIVSQYSLAISYAYGEGVPQDPKEAVRWFNKAAAQGYARAQVHLGSMYHTGEGVDQDFTEAARWYRLAADRGDATAQYNLGTMYRLGKGVEKNYAQAKRWFRQSADQGYAAAQNELASLERSAAANVTTRTIQTKPELPSVKETIPEPALAKKVEPIEEKVIAQKVETEEAAQIISPDTIDSKKKPLFSVEKEGLLSLDDTKRDIAEPKVAVEEEIEKEVVAQAEEIIPVETVLEETEIAKTNNSSPIHNALGLPAPTSTLPETESSDGFFDKLFSTKENSETDVAVTETKNIIETIEEKPIVEATPKPAKKEVVITPRTYPEDLKNSEPAQAEKIKAVETDTAEIEERESSAGLFSAIGDFFSGEDKIEEASIDENVTATEVELDNVLVAKLEEPAPAVEEIELAKKVESDLSQYSIQAGRHALANNDYDEAFKQFEPLAGAGDSQAQSHLGSLYYVGKGTTKNLNEAYNWYKKAADQGNVDAQYSIGNMYLLGEGIEQNNAHAAEWYTLASNQGHIAARNNLKSLEKLERLNRKNQLKLDALAAKQNAKEESYSVVKNETEVVTALNEEKIETNSETLVEEEKSGLLGLLGGIFGSKSPEDESTEYIQTNEVTFDEKQQTEVVELLSSESNVNTYAAGDAPSTESLQAIANEDADQEIQTINPSDEVNVATEEIERSNKIATVDDSQTSESPNFFNRLFSNDDVEQVTEVDSVTLESTDEIASTDSESIKVEEVTPPAIEIKEETQEVTSVSDETVAEITKGNESKEESNGLFGFIGNIFSSENKNNSIETEASEELAMLETESIQTTSTIDESVAEALVEETIEKTEIERLRPLATQGDKDAQYRLGALYYLGKSVEQDYSQAALWYRRAAQQGNVEAQFSLGNMFLMGEGIRQDDSQAAHWYALAAEQGHNSAKHNLDSLHNLQKTQSNNPQVEVATSSNNSQLISLDDDQSSEAIASEDTTGKAEYEQGLAYTFGDGVAQNDRTAFNLFYEAAEKGYVLAQYKVGVAFAYGEGVRQDQKKAVEWYRSAAEQGYTIAQRNLATMYLEGKGVEQNKVQALAWYQVVANTGNALDLHRRDKLKNELSDIELSESQELSNQISSRLINPSL